MYSYMNFITVKGLKQSQQRGKVRETKCGGHQVQASMSPHPVELPECPFLILNTPREH